MWSVYNGAAILFERGILLSHELVLHVNSTTKCSYLVLDGKRSPSSKEHKIRRSSARLNTIILYNTSCCSRFSLAYMHIVCNVGILSIKCTYHSRGPPYVVLGLGAVAAASTNCK